MRYRSKWSKWEAVWRCGCSWENATKTDSKFTLYFRVNKHRGQLDMKIKKEESI
jgi:hypothetical protein